ncbi:MAG: hypothetical protein AAGI38_19880 [Bacteroidota bacterium]
MRKQFLVAAAALVLLAIPAYLFLGSAETPSVANTQTEVSTDAPNIYSSFSVDEAHANERFTGKVVEVSGQLMAVEQDEAGSYSLSLDSQDPMGKVVCKLSDATSTELAQLQIGETVTIKGTCMGYLFDVIIEQGVITQLPS